VITVKIAQIKPLIVESVILLLLASLVGIGVNRKLLVSTWSGKPIVSAPSSGPQMAIPLPLGLMQVKELFDRKEAVIIDSRDRNTFASGHIKGAVPLPLLESATAVPEFSGRIPKTAMLVIYCNGYACEDSVELGKLLISAGYSAVYYFDGGFPAWRDANYPTAGGK
jgi:rhodanese-related sulfurtransferase